ncbi:ABC transporter ATP-binding protein [Antarcticimicrobium luteum]|uniref:Nickel import system ATP-binding protein NikD n=1 Tax=Antarcticimicrobium luteum TaxID=2547397 RepID=A0A4R5UQS4_9RHOB|nr:ABC transporter ATP-binding protein [Antarcticimicrobium luteum]TDK41382.1 ABC transporter ATP-binding protein [Antarcticimicrobium luteum]
MSHIVTCENLVVTYRASNGPVRALDGVDLTISEGETLAIVGESGSGKSTLGMAMGRLLPAEAEREDGRMDVAGQPVFDIAANDLRELRRDLLGFVFQNPMVALDPTMRIGRQMQRAMGRRAGSEEIHALLERAELDDPARVAKSFPHQLSGGMAQRVVIAMASARTPRLLIADEPTASLDASIRDKVMGTLCRLRAESGASLVILSHDVHMIARHADRVAVMYGGRIVEQGPTGRVLDAPVHPYTRALLKAAAGHEKPGDWLTPIPGTPPLLSARCAACSFEPRCTVSEENCHTTRPEPREVEGREVLCLLAGTQTEPKEAAR